MLNTDFSVFYLSSSSQGRISSTETIPNNSLLEGSIIGRLIRLYLDGRRSESRIVYTTKDSKNDKMVTKKLRNKTMAEAQWGCKLL